MADAPALAGSHETPLLHVVPPQQASLGAPQEHVPPEQLRFELHVVPQQTSPAAPHGSHDPFTHSLPGEHGQPGGPVSGGAAASLGAASGLVILTSLSASNGVASMMRASGEDASRPVASGTVASRKVASPKVASSDSASLTSASRSEPISPPSSSQSEGTHAFTPLRDAPAAPGGP